MNIAIDLHHLKASNFTGTQRYIYELAKNLSLDKNYNGNIIGLCDRNANFNRKSLNITYRNKLIEKNNHSKVDLFHKTTQVFQFNELIDLLIPKKTVITIHDLILYKTPDYFINNYYYEKHKQYVDLSLKIVDKILTNSDYTKNDIIKTCNIPEEKIQTIHFGIDKSIFYKEKDPNKILEYRKKNNLPDRFILYITTDYPHKNLDNLFKAFYKVKQNPNYKDLYLVITGSKQYIKGKSYLKDSYKKIKDSIKYIGYVKDDDIHLLYNSAQMFVFPSLHEGFGFPVLEAFACEIPLLCSDAASLPEIAGDGAYFFDGNNIDEIAQSIITVSENKNLRTQLIKKGTKRVKYFTWEKCIDNTLKVYENLLKSKENKNNIISNILEETIKTGLLDLNQKPSFKTKINNSLSMLKNIGVKNSFSIVYRKLLRKKI